jgi:hypothetical protein
VCYINSSGPPRCSLHTTAHSLWTALDQCNTSLGQTLTRLSQLHEQDQHAYVETVRWVSGLQPVQVRLPFRLFTAFYEAAVHLHTRFTVARKPQYGARASDVPRGVLRSAPTHRGNSARSLGPIAIISLNGRAALITSKYAAKCARWENFRASRSSPRNSPSFSMLAPRWQASSEVAFPAVRVSPPLFLTALLTNVSHSGRIRCCMAARVCAAGGHAWDPASPARRAALDDSISRRCTDARARKQGPGCRD